MPETQLRRRGALWTKITPNWRGFHIWTIFHLEWGNSQEESTVEYSKISTRQKSLEKPDSYHMITCLMVRYRERNVKERNGERHRETEIATKEEGA